MTHVIDSELITDAQRVAQWSQKLLTNADLTTEQHDDILAMSEAAHNFIAYAETEWIVIDGDAPQQDKQRVRHQLRNYLNIVVGFSKLLVKELPDNLLLHMATIRKIHTAGQKLMQRVEGIE
ncbi:MAG: hypothetical protein AAFQ07_17115 [Chloroflexota bacterium]